MNSITDLLGKVSFAKKMLSTDYSRKELIHTEHQLKELGEILKYARDYQTNKVYTIRKASSIELVSTKTLS